LAEVDFTSAGLMEQSVSRETSAAIESFAAGAFVALSGQVKGIRQ
jgi:hypothetical protein